MKFHANHEGFLKFYASAVGAEEDEDDDDDDDDDNDLAQIQNSDSVSQEENGEESGVKIERRRKKTKQGGASLEKEDSYEDSSEDIGFKSSGIGDTVADEDEDELAQIQAANK